MYIGVKSTIILSKNLHCSARHKQLFAIITSLPRDIKIRVA